MNKNKPKIFLILLLLKLVHAEFKWQKLGNCGVPASRPNHNIFENIYEKIEDTLSVDRPVDSGPLLGNEIRTSKDLRSSRANTQSPIIPDGRIVGGQVALPHSWPWQAHLAVCGRWYGHLECNICGGSVINPRFIVSAAHCVPSGPSGNLVLGAHSISAGGKQRIPVQHFHVHPEWNRPTLFDHDLSVLELKDEAKITSFVIPICLPHPTTCFGVDTPCVVTGWGLTDERGGFPDELHEVAVRLMGQDHCKTYEGYQETVSDNMLCAGYVSGQQDACAGDSGGPLVCSLPGGGWVLYGVVSWGYGCARAQSPGVYSRVNTMLQFIKDITGLYPDEDLAMPNKQCKTYEMGFEDQWKVNNQNYFQTVKPDWFGKEDSIPEPVISNDDDHCNYDATSDGVKVFTSEEYPLGHTITSENYPKFYPNNQDCSFSIINKNPANYIKLTIHQTRLDCRDKLLLKPSNSKPVSICRTKRPLTLKESSAIDISFLSNSSKGAMGFKLTFTFNSMYFMCNGDPEVNLDNSMKRGIKPVKIRSENYPRLYSPKSQCRWIVRADPGDVVGIYLRRFATENRDCSASNDNLMIFAAEDCTNETLKSSNMWGTLCGVKKKRYKYNTGLKTVCLAFIADGDNIRNRGFELQLYGIQDKDH